LRSVHCSKACVRISISTSDRNRHNRPQKRGYPLLGESGHDLPLSKKWKARRHDRRTRHLRRIGNRANQVKFGKQFCGAYIPWRCHDESALCYNTGEQGLPDEIKHLPITTGPPPTMSSMGSNVPGALNSRVAPRASPAAKPKKLRL